MEYLEICGINISYHIKRLWQCILSQSFLFIYFLSNFDLILI